MPVRTDFERFGGHVPLFDFYENWRDHRRQLLEAGINPRTNEPFPLEIREALASGDRRILEASPDTRADFATFLWEPLQANFYAGYETAESQWRRYVGRERVDTFDEVRIKGLNGFSGIGLVGELGERPGLRRTFRPEASVVIETYGADYSMTRRLLRSNGVEKLTANLPELFGEAMGDWITRMIIGFLVANPTAPDGVALHSNTRGNLSTTAIGIEGLVEAAVWLRTRKSPDGRPLKLKLKTAVTQNDRAALLLRQAVESQYLQIQTSGTTEAANKFGRGTSNPIVGSEILPNDGIVIDPWLPDGQDVYYFCDPARNPAIFAAFLDGNEKPMIAMADKTLTHLANSNGSGEYPYSITADSIDYVMQQDVGVSTLEPLSTYKQSPA